MAMKHISDAQVCLAIAAYRYDGLPFADSRLEAMTGQPPKVCHRALERAYDRGFIECGVSVRSGWLTDKGRALLLAWRPPELVGDADRIIAVGRATK